ncbi:MAG TPA: ABC transporter permease subunit [Thermoanaerobaculia bacterium]
MNPTVVAETVRRHVTSIPYLGYLVLLAIMAFGVSRMDNMPGRIWPPLIALLSYIVGCSVIGPEFSSGTLQLILAKPVNRTVYLVSRVLGATAVVWIALLVPMLIELLGRKGQHAQIILGTTLNYALMALLTVSLMALFGSFTRAYFNIAIYFVLSIGLSVVQGAMGMLQMAREGFFAWLGKILTDFPAIPKAIVWIDQNLFPDAPPRANGSFALMVLSNAAVALVVACLLFRRREVPYGAD